MLTCVLVTRSPGAGDKTIHPFTGDQTWPVPDPLLLTMTMTALNWPQPPADTPTLACPTLRTSSAPQIEVRVCRSSDPSRVFPLNGREGAQGPPSSGLFVGRHGFCSSCFSLIVKFSFALNSLPLFFLPAAAFIFWAKTKKSWTKRTKL